MKYVDSRQIRSHLLSRLVSARLQLQSHRSGDDVVHGVRKHLTQARALLRLQRTSLGGSQYHTINFALRDVGRMYRDARDAEVLLVSLAWAYARWPGLRSGSKTFRSQLLRDTRRGRLPRAQYLSGAKRLQEIERQTWMAYHARRHDDSPREDLARTYRRARRSFLAAQHGDDDAKWHECRKQTKFLRVQLQYLRPFGPRRWRRLSATAGKLADVLGEERDLGLLGSHALRRRTLFDSSATFYSMLRNLQRRRARLRHQAEKRARELYYPGTGGTP